MTPWGNVFFLLASVALCWNCSSAQEPNCQALYFSWSHYVEHFDAFLPLVVASNFQDSMECTAERECLKEESINKTHLIVLLVCFGRNDPSFDTNNKCTETPKCKALESDRNISYYHFLCLTAEALNFNTTEIPIDCEYDYYNKIRKLPRADQTTTQPLPLTTTAIVKTTTSVKTTTTEKATTTTTQLPERTTAAPTMSQPGSQSRTTSGAAHLQSTLTHANGSSTSEQVNTNQEPVISVVTVLLVASVIGNVMCFLYIKHQNRQHHIQTDGLVLTPAGIQPLAEMESHTANGRGVESSHLLQPDSVVIDTAEQNSHV